MDHRVVIAAVFALVLVAFGGFYFALSQFYSALTRHDPLSASRPVALAARPSPSAAGSEAQAPAAGPSLAAQSSTPATPAAPIEPQKVTFQTIETEIARSDHGDLQKLLKQHFPDEYKDLIEIAVRQRNEGASDLAVGEQMFARF